ncbi:MAG: FtsX-like permease family protein [Gammaproteobacteria bacterium]|nr:FtsX-like permease family protein [Gammaproteobacteria bacterium]
MPEAERKHAGARAGILGRLALRSLVRDWRSGELALVLGALVLAVAATSAVGFFTDRIGRALAFESGALLGGDLAVESGDPLPGALLDSALAHGLDVARTLAFRSVAVAGDRLELAEIKAVDGRYPLRGSLVVADAPFGIGRETRDVPASGEIWVEARLLQALDVAVGDRVGLGATQFVVAAVLQIEPDRGGDLFNIAPRVLMHLDDVARTGLVVRGSRVTYRWLFAGPPAGVQALRKEAGDTGRPGLRLRTVDDARPEIRAALARAQQFLGLAALVAVVVAGIAIATAASRYVSRHFDTVAILRCVGATQAAVLTIIGVELGVLGLLGGALGIVAGWIAQSGLAAAAGRITGAALPAAGAGPALQGLLTGMLALVGFALPQLLRLRAVPPARVLRRDLEPPSLGGWISFGAPVLVIVLLAPKSLAEPQLTAWVVGASVAAVALLALSGWAFVRGADRLRAHATGVWRIGLAAITRRAGTSVLQAVTLGLGLTVMLLLTIVRGDLLAGWRASLPPAAPNHFLVNVQTGEREALRRWFAARELTPPALHPMVRARLTHVNGVAVDVDGYDDPRARRLAERDFNLSWATVPGKDNQVVAGRWWSATANPLEQLSIERGIALTLGFALGDELRFSVAGEPVSGRITSLREVAWDSFNVNFFVLAPPGLLERFPATWITAFHLEPGAQSRLVELVRAFPSVTVIDVDAMMRQVRRIIDRVTLAVEYVFGFTVLAGLLVLYAALQATHDERIREAAVLRALGARNGQVRAGIVVELLVLGALCGAVAAITATAAGYALARFVFDLPYSPGYGLWPLAVAAGSVAVTLVGWLGMRPVLTTPAAVVLRRL